MCGWSKKLGSEIFGSNLSLKELLLDFLVFLDGFLSLMDFNVSDKFLKHCHLLFILLGLMSDRLVLEISSVWLF